MSAETKERIDATTRYCAVFGHPIAHSASPAMQNAGMAALGLNWRYLAFDVAPERLREAIEGARVMGFIGVNLTVPHKLLALEMVDVVDDQAKRWGAVNTIAFVEDGNGVTRSHGFNTDADAIVRALKEAFHLPGLKGLSALVLGAGGAARAAVLRLAEEDLAAIYLVNRTMSRARELAAAARAAVPRVRVECGYPHGAVDLVLNATSLGLKEGDQLPVDGEWFGGHRPRFVYDMIYRPMETALLRKAREAGCLAANGAGMLLYQGARSLELWTGRAAPVETMRTALERHLYV